MAQRTTYIKKITTAQVVEHWGPELVVPNGHNYATCNAQGAIKWGSARLITAQYALEKRYVLINNK